jgi:hypothetical protein
MKSFDVFWISRLRKEMDMPSVKLKVSGSMIRFKITLEGPEEDAARAAKWLSGKFLDLKLEDHKVFINKRAKYTFTTCEKTKERNVRCQ